MRIDFLMVRFLAVCMIPGSCLMCKGTPPPNETNDGMRRLKGPMTLLCGKHGF